MSALTSLVQSIITIVIFVGMLGVLVVVHELGHFIAARLSGIRVLEFGIGFPPRARILRSKGETLYTLNWLPIGGFVKLEGEEGVIEGQGQATPAGTGTGASPSVDQRSLQDPRSFAVAPLPKKLIILAAGVTMNLLLAFLIMAGISWLANPTTGISFAVVQPDSPAQRAGLIPGDVILSVNGRYFDAYSPPTILDEIRAHAGGAVVLGLRHPDGRVEDVKVTLRPPSQIDSEHGALGISGRDHQPLQPVFTGKYITHDPLTALRLGAERTGNAFLLIIRGLGELGDAIINRPTEPPPVSGPVGIAVGVGDVFWQEGPIPTLFLAGLLSANLALVNILPLPPLDGGRMLMLLIRAVVGTRLSLQVERLTYVVGFGFLMVFLAWITFFDIARQVGGGQ